MNLKKLSKNLSEKDINQVHNLRHHGKYEPGFEQEERRNIWTGEVAQHLFGVQNNGNDQEN